MNICTITSIAVMLSLGVCVSGFADNIPVVPDDENPLLMGGGAIAQSIAPAPGEEGAAASAGSGAESMLNSILEGKPPEIFRGVVDDPEYANQKHKQMIDRMQGTASDDE